MGGQDIPKKYVATILIILLVVFSVLVAVNLLSDSNKDDEEQEHLQIHNGTETNEMELNTTISTTLLTTLLTNRNSSQQKPRLFPTPYAVILDTKLPWCIHSQGIIYDGEDSIYLFGGCNDRNTDTIQKFSISSQTLEIVGYLPVPSRSGSVQWDHDHLKNKIFYFGGGSEGDQIYSFDLTTRNCSFVAEFPYNIRNTGSIKYRTVPHPGRILNRALLYGSSMSSPSSSNFNTVYILGGHGSSIHNILSFDLVTSEIIRYNANFGDYTWPSAAARVGNKAFIYGGRTNFGKDALFQLDLDSFNTTRIGEGSYLEVTEYPKSVLDEESSLIYFIGGYKPNPYQSYSYSFPTGGIIQLNPVSLKSSFIPVINFPVDGNGLYHVAPDCVFVQKESKRIYCFGGYQFETGVGPQNSIFYVEL